MLIKTMRPLVPGINVKAAKNRGKSLLVGNEMYIIDYRTIRDQILSFTVLTSKAYLFSLFTQLLFANPEARYSSDGL